jgi:hypothetical protein
MKFYQNFKSILNANEIFAFLLISVGLIVASIIELFGISLIIPIVYTSISDSFYLKFVNYLSNYNIIFSTKKDLLIFALIIFSSVFIIKNILLAFFYWYEGKFIYTVAENISSKIFKQFLYKDYGKHLKKKSAELPAKIKIDLNYVKNFFNALLIFISEIVIFIGLLVGLIFFAPESVLKILPIFIISFYIFIHYLHHLF